MDKDEVKICSICFRNYTGWGNNAEPINPGRCCDSCNELVIAARLNNLNRTFKQHEKEHGPIGTVKSDGKPQ